MSVARLGSLSFDVKDVPAWKRLLVDLLGMEARPQSSAAEPLLIRFDDHEHRIALYPGDEDRIRAITWEVDTPEQLRALASRVEAAGHPVKWADRADNASRTSVESFTFTDPEGFNTEIRYGATFDHVPFRPGSVISGFVTGELGMGHVVLIAQDYPGTVDFYTNVLGFKLSDYIVWDEEADATFFHINPRHHSLALMNECFGQRGGDFNHLMVETATLDDVGRAYDLIVSEGIPLTMDFGRHTNDEVTSFYLRSPSGFAVEVGYGGLLVNDDDWDVKTYRATARWGHGLVKS